MICKKNCNVIATSPTNGIEMCLTEDGNVFIWGVRGPLQNITPTLINPSIWAYDKAFDGKPNQLSASLKYCAVLTVRPLSLKLICVKYISRTFPNSIFNLPNELPELIRLANSRNDTIMLNESELIDSNSTNKEKKKQKRNSITKNNML